MKEVKHFVLFFGCFFYFMVLGLGLTVLAVLPGQVFAKRSGVFLLKAFLKRFPCVVLSCVPAAQPTIRSLSGFQDDVFVSVGQGNERDQSLPRV